MQIFVKPASGVKVRLPDTKKHIPDTGALVEQSSYILRRIAEGSLSVVDRIVTVSEKSQKREGDKQ